MSIGFIHENAERPRGGQGEVFEFYNSKLNNKKNR